MRLLSQLLLGLGTVVGALAGARQHGISYPILGVGLLILIAGGLLLRRERRASVSSSDDPGSVPQLMRKLSEEVSALEARKSEMELSEIAATISELDTRIAQPLGDACPALLHQYGAARYAAIFGTYARGERALARAWSAAIDQHKSEARASLGQAAAVLKQACAELDRSS